MSRLKCFVFVALCLFVFAPASGQGADLSPYLDSETIAVVRINLKQVNLPEIIKYYETAILKAFDEVIPKNDPETPQMKQSLQMIMGMAPMMAIPQHEELIVKNKVEEIHVIVYRDALMKQIFPVLLAVPVPEGASQEQIDAIRMQYLNLQIPVTFVRHGFIVGIPVSEPFASQQKVMAFAREKFQEPSSQSRPEIVTALNSQSEALLQVVVGKIDQFQKDVEKQINMFKPMLMMTMSKEQKADLDQALKLLPVIFQSLNSYCFTYDYAKSEIRQVIQLKDEQTAKMFQAMNLEQMKKSEEELDKIPIVKTVFETSAVNPQNRGITPESKAAIKAFLKVIQMKQQGNDVVTLIDSSGMAKLETVIYEFGIKSMLAGFYTGYKSVN